MNLLLICLSCCWLLPGKAEESLILDVPEAPTALTEDDFERSHDKSQVARIDFGETDDPLQQPNNKFEGDIVIDHGEEERAVKSATVQYSAISNSRAKWPDGRVPYKLSTRYSRRARSTIAAAMDEFSKHTCVEFVPYGSGDKDYIYLMPDEGCYSEVGRSGYGEQIVSLDSGCIDKGVIMHELLHVIGFFHEQSRTDRDSHVDVRLRNVYDGYANQFDKYSHFEMDLLNEPYDYDSIMHYGRKAFSKNGKDTIVPNVASAEIGQRRGFSVGDLSKVNKLYECDTSSSVLKPEIQEEKEVIEEIVQDCMCIEPRRLADKICSFLKFFGQTCCPESQCGSSSSGGGWWW